MTAFQDEPDPSSSSARPALPKKQLSEKRWLFALPVLAVLGWTVSAFAPRPAALHEMGHALQEFRSGAPEGAGPNQAMSAALVVRSQLLMHRISRVSAAQEAMLLGILSGPTDDIAQSEALDVIGIAKRMNALSTAQQQGAAPAVLKLLRRMPGPMVRLESARLLGHLEDAQAAPALRILQADADPKVQEAAKNALARVAATPAR